MINIRFATKEDKDFWLKLDEHISDAELNRKIRDNRGYVITHNGILIGILRYNLFWDNIPFCTMIYIEQGSQNKGYGKILLEFWEKEMKQLGYGMIMTSTQSDEDAQHFYRKLGFHDAGGLIINIPEYAQPMELFFVKEI